MKKLIYILFVFSLFSCQNKGINNKKANIQTIQIQDSIVGKQELLHQDTINEKQIGKTTFKNQIIDTTYFFGVWAENRSNPHADFLINKNEFYIADYDGDGSLPYLLNGNTIEIFYKDFSRKGLIYSVSKDTLIIKWNDDEQVSKYARYKNGYDYSKKEIINTIDSYIANYKNNIDKGFIINELNSKLNVLDKMIYDEFDRELFDKLCQLIIKTNKNKRDISTDILAKIYMRYQDTVYKLVYNDYKNQSLIDILEFSYINDKIYKKENSVFNLKMPNVEKLKKQYEYNFSLIGVMYLYLTNNYKPTSKKKDIVKNNYKTDKRICSFRQEFNKIEYYLNYCGEKGSVEKIQISKINLDTVRKWIEHIYIVTDCDNCIKNKWNENKMIFEPIDGGAGCYYIIKKIEDKIEITIECGC